MSRIYFHSEDGTAEVSGAERAHAGLFVDRVGCALIDADWHETRDLLAAAIVGGVGNCDVRTMLRSSFYGAKIRLADGSEVEPWTVHLNTVLRVGSCPARLLARLHGQCEVHAWVDGHNREWLAEIIEEGRRDGLMREDMGWESVADLLRSTASGPVVTSYSVCEQFPNRTVAGWSDSNYGDDWYDLTAAERWDMAMGKLRESSGGLELRPDDFAAFYFLTDVSAINLLSKIRGHAAEERGEPR